MNYRYLWVFLVMAFFTAHGSVQAFEQKMGDPHTGAMDPDGVLKAIEQSVRQRNFDDYRSVLADSFVYVPDLATVAMYPSIDWANWGIAEEEGFLDRLLSPVLKAELNLTESINERGMPYQQRARYEITYKLIIEGQVFIAEALFLFVEVNNKWYLWKWEEMMPVTNQSTGTTFTNSGEVRASLSP